MSPPVLDGNDVVLGNPRYTATATDSCDANPTLSQEFVVMGKPLNDPYPVGVTTILWTALDAAGNPAQCQQTVNVTFTPSLANDITSFTIPGQVGAAAINPTDHTVNLGGKLCNRT